jgi:hypothetical protein
MVWFDGGRWFVLEGSFNATEKGGDGGFGRGLLNSHIFHW